MSISFQCPECDKSFRVADDKRGKRIKCSGCSTVVTVPDDDEEVDAEPEPVRRSKNSGKGKAKPKGKSVGFPPGVWIGVAGAAVVAIGLLIWMMVPRGPSAEQVAADVKQDRSRLQKLGLAMYNYHDTHMQFPVADFPATNFGPDGRPHLSWRVHLLPVLSHLDLYNQFHLNEPWDSPHNVKLIDQMPDEFRSGSGQGTSTRMVTLTGPHGLFFQRKVGLRDITDGSSNTVMIVQVGPDKAVPWTKPDDVEFDPANPLVAFGKIGKTFLCTMADGMVREIDATIDAKTMAAIASAKGGEIVDLAKLSTPQAGQGSTPSAVSPTGAKQTPATPAASTPQSNAASSAASLEGGEIFDGKAFKLKIPKGWIIKFDAVVALHTRATHLTPFPNIKVAILKPPADATMSTVVNASKESYLKSGTVEELTETTLQGRPVHRLLMTQNLPGNVNRQLKYFIPAGERILIFSGQDKAESFESAMPLFEEVIRSLEVTP